MNYILILAMLSGHVVTVGPFGSVHACEKAAGQAQTLGPKVRTTCIDLNAKPHHWNGKELKK